MHMLKSLTSQKLVQVDVASCPLSEQMTEIDYTNFSTNSRLFLSSILFQRGSRRIANLRPDSTAILSQIDRSNQRLI